MPKTTKFASVPRMATVIERRAAMFAFSRTFRDPALTVIEAVTVPDFRSRLRLAGVRGVHFLLHALARASLQVPQFRLRVRGEKIVEIAPDELHCSYVVQNPHTDINHCSVLFSPELATFAAVAQQQEGLAQQAREIIPPAPDPDHITAINLSIIPWLRLNALTQGSCSPIPLFTIGKFSSTATAQLDFNFCVMVNHGLADAYHIHQLIEQFCSNITAQLASLPEDQDG